MNVANLGQYFNDIAVEVDKKTAEAVMPKGSLVFVVQAHPISDRIEWSWRLSKRVPEDVVAGVTMTVKPDLFELGIELKLTLGAYEGEERINQTAWRNSGQQRKN